MDGDGPATFFLPIIILGTVLVVLCVAISSCTGENSNNGRESYSGRSQPEQLQHHALQQPRPLPSQPSRRDQRDPQQQITNDRLIIDQRPYLGHILKSITTHSNNDDYIDGIIAPTATNDIETNCGDVQLVADFGDFEVLPVEETYCPICLTEYDHGDRIQRSASLSRTASSSSTITSYCDHIFHERCIVQWMATSSCGECPICRRNFVIGKGGSDIHSHNNINDRTSSSATSVTIVAPNTAVNETEQ